MSKEILEQFLARVDASEDLQEKIGEEIDIDAMIALGAEQGFEFNVEDLEGAAELSEEDLDGVAGGFVVGPTGSNSRVGFNVGPTGSNSSVSIEPNPSPAPRFSFRVRGRSRR